MVEKERESKGGRGGGNGTIWERPLRGRGEGGGRGDMLLKVI